MTKAKSTKEIVTKKRGLEAISIGFLRYAAVAVAVVEEAMTAVARVAAAAVVAQ